MANWLKAGTFLSPSLSPSPDIYPVLLCTGTTGGPGGPLAWPGARLRAGLHRHARIFRPRGGIAGPVPGLSVLPCRATLAMGRLQQLHRGLGTNLSAELLVLTVHTDDHILQHLPWHMCCQAWGGWDALGRNVVPGCVQMRRWGRKLWCGFTGKV